VGFVHGVFAMNLPQEAIDTLLQLAWGHSPEAARKSRLIEVAIQQWDKKAPLDRPRERQKIEQDLQDLAGMLGVRS
jgi:hypothetical protein